MIYYLFYLGLVAIKSSIDSKPLPSIEGKGRRGCYNTANSIRSAPHPTSGRIGTLFSLIFVVRVKAQVEGDL